MMFRLDRANLIPAIVAAGVLLLVLAGAGMVMYNEASYKEAKTQQAEAQGRVLASTVTAALAFDDRKAAHEYVNALAVDPQIQAAAVYDAKGNLFAAYARAGAHPVPAGAQSSDPRVDGELLKVAVPVRQARNTLGTVYLETAIDPISRRLERYGILALLVSMASLIFVLIGIAQGRLADANERLRRQGIDLAEANDNLRAQIAQRETVEGALRQAQKMEAMGQLTGGIAHDFNNLLQVILGNLELLQRRNLVADDDAKRMVATAARGAERAATLTQRLLAFARRQPLDPRPIDVNKLVQGMSDMLHRTLGESIRIETVLAGGIWRVAVDANQLENAVLNLAVNARDAMSAAGATQSANAASPRGSEAAKPRAWGDLAGGAGKLTIETANVHLDEPYADANEVRPGQYVMIAVSDTGAGMTPEVAAKAFEPFFTTKDVGKGSGLGLSQVYGFIKQSGGHAKIYSERGEGTTIKLYLPRLAGAAGDERAASASALPAGREDRRILVVEDDEDVRAHAVTMLKELGYAVLEAADADSALRLLDGHPDVRLLFTDVGLPGGRNGRELADEVRRRRPELPVLFTTGYARNAIVHHGRLDPGVDLITKPFTFAALANKVHGMFERRAGGAREAPQP
jgi:signal transduction histidine kinase/ActR/RegA family two-component response regulator